MKEAYLANEADYAAAKERLAALEEALGAIEAEADARNRVQEGMIKELAAERAVLLGQNKGLTADLAKLRKDLDHYLRLAVRLATANQVLKAKLEQERCINQPLRDVRLSAPTAAQLLGSTKVMAQVAQVYNIAQDDERAKLPLKPAVVPRGDIVVRALPRQTYTTGQLVKLVRAVKCSVNLGLLA